MALPDGWKTSYCTLIAEGYTRNDAAQAVGVSPRTVSRHQADDPEFGELYREARETVRDTLRNEIWKLRFASNESTSRWAYDHLIKWNLPEAAEKTRFEITGDGGGPVAIQHEQRLTLAHLYAFARSVPGLGDSDIGQLPDVDQVLSAPEDGGAAAGVVPARPVP